MNLQPPFKYHIKFLRGKDFMKTCLNDSGTLKKIETRETQYHSGNL